MSLLQAIILGIIQGLTEFLPISSSAHLVIIPYLLGWDIPEEQVFVFGVLVQLGTLVAVIIYFWKDLLSIVAAFLRGIWQRQPFADFQSRLGWYLILATIPAGLAGPLMKDVIEAGFNSPIASAVFLFGTAILLVIAERVGRRTRCIEEMGWKDALVVGIFQIIALFPGISRSGSTITGGMVRHLNRPSAGRFAFLMSVPVMLAAGLLTSLDLLDIPNLNDFLPVIVAGFITAAIVGYLSIRWLLSYLMSHSLDIFAIYCAAFGAFTLLFYFVF